MNFQKCVALSLFISIIFQNNILCLSNKEREDLTTRFYQAKKINDSIKMGQIIEKVGSGNYYDRKLARKFCIEMGDVTIKPTVKYKEKEAAPKPEPKVKQTKAVTPKPNPKKVKAVKVKTTKKPIKKVVAEKVVGKKPALDTNTLLKSISLGELEDILETVKKYLLIKGKTTKEKALQAINKAGEKIARNNKSLLETIHNYTDPENQSVAKKQTQSIKTLKKQLGNFVNNRLKTMFQKIKQKQINILTPSERKDYEYLQLLEDGKIFDTIRSDLQKKLTTIKKLTETTKGDLKGKLCLEVVKAAKFIKGINELINLKLDQQLDETFKNMHNLGWLDKAKEWQAGEVAKQKKK